MSKSDILFLAHRIPYPPDKGDKIRSWNLLRHLTERYNVHLGCFVDDPEDMVHKEFLESITKSCSLLPLSPKIARLKSLKGLLTGEALSLTYYQSPVMKKYISKVRRKYPCVAQIAFSSSMAPYLVEQSAATKIATLIDFCDSDAEKWRAYGQASSSLMGAVYRREGRVLAKVESQLANQADIAFAITPQEAKIFNDRDDLKNTVDYWENGVDTVYFDPDADFNGEIDVNSEIGANDIVFVGAMDYQANIDAVQWFVETVWPDILKRREQCRFAIVGSNPAATIKAMDGHNNIKVTGRVADVRPWLKSASMVVAPLRVARGIQNKVLEAMAMAKPVVATSGAAQGVNVEDEKNILIADDAKSMGNEIIAVLDGSKNGTVIGENARQLVVDHYGWAPKLKRFENRLETLIGK